MDRQFPRRAARCFIAAVLLLAAGASQAVRIRDLIDDPRTYVDRTVTIDGEVVGMLSLFVVKYFTVNDGTASINVFTAKPLPRKGQRIRVTGKVELADNVKMVMPGDDIDFTVELISPIAMEEGMRFAIREGGRTIGAGRVTKIIK